MNKASINLLKVILFIFVTCLIVSGCTQATSTTTIPDPTSTFPPPTAVPSTPTLTNTPVESEGIPVVIDTDMAADDWMAILYLFQRPEISVKAITVSGTGEAHCEAGVQNALGLIKLAGYDSIPVACGRETPLKGNHVFPDSWRGGVDSLYGLTLPEGENPNQTLNAVELLTSVILTSSEKVSVLTLGPLTTLAEVFQNTPSITDNIEGVFIMGGAVDVPGNIAVSGAGIDNTVAEWNIYIDPYAANVVFQSGVPTTLVALNATNYTPLTREIYDRFTVNHITPESTFIYDLYTMNSWYFDLNTLYFWDQVSAVMLSDESFSTFENKTLCVVEEEGAQSGQTKIGEGCPLIRVAISVDRERFESLFLDTLNGQVP